MGKPLLIYFSRCAAAYDEVLDLCMIYFKKLRILAWGFRGRWCHACGCLDNWKISAFS
jgi:hypothetical protein